MAIPLTAYNEQHNTATIEDKPPDYQVLFPNEQAPPPDTIAAETTTGYENESSSSGRINKLVTQTSV